MTTIIRPATHDEVNGVRDPLYVYELVAGVGLVAHVPDEIPTEGERIGDLDLDLIAHLMRTDYDVDAYPGQMGGNCGAICYGGDVDVEEGGQTFQTAKFLAGPGTYRTSYGHSTSTLHEFGTAMDTYVAGTDDVTSIDAADVGAFTHSDIARLLAMFAKYGTVDGLDADTLTIAGFDSTLRSRPRWLAEDEASIALQVAEHNRINRAKREQAAAARSYIPEGY